MQVEWYIQLHASLVEYIPLGRIVKDRGVRLGPLVVIDERAQKAILRYASSEFVSCRLRVVHRESSETPQSLRVPLDLLGEPVVGFDGSLGSFFRVSEVYT